MSFLFGSKPSSNNDVPSQITYSPEFPSSASTSTPSQMTTSSVFKGLEFDKKTMKPQIAPNAEMEFIYLDDPALPPGVPAPPGMELPAERPSGSWGPLPMRTDGDKMLYGAGAAYIAGQALGGTYGFVRGWQNPQATTLKLKINSVLNTCTRTGPWMANHAGVLAFSYACVDSLFARYRGVQDYTNHVAAAFVVGAIFKSTAGFRRSLIMGSTMATGVVLYGLADAYRKGELDQVSFKLPNRSTPAAV